MGIKETRKKIQRSLEHLAATEKPEVVVRELRHVMETCVKLLEVREPAVPQATQP